MEVKDFEETMNLIFKDVFSLRDFVLNNAMTARDVPGWDSINHIRLVLKIESTFKVKFTIKEIQSFDNVGSLLSVTQKKIDSRL